MADSSPISLTSTSLAGAFFAAALALAGKTSYDWWARFDQRRGIAAAFVGEVGAYVEIIEEADLVLNLRKWVGIPPELREVILRALPPLPTEHPVFDKMADKLAFLPRDQCVQISRFYNAVTSMRLLVMNMRTTEFIALAPDIQNTNFCIVANIVEKEFGTARRELMPALYRIADNTVPKVIRGLFNRVVLFVERQIDEWKTHVWRD